MNHLSLTSIIVMLFAIQGCSITGLSGKSEFSCNMPGEQGCKNLDQVYSMTKENREPLTRTDTTNAADTPSLVSERVSIPKTTLNPDSPIYVAPQVQRIWMAPFEDSDGVLHDQSYRYLVLNNGGWQVAHTKANVKKFNRGPLMDMIPTVGKEASEQ